MNIMGEPKIMMSEIVSRIWICPDCGTEYDTLGNGTMRFCPQCADDKKELEKQYWKDKSAGMRSVASDIVARILEQNNA